VRAQRPYRAPQGPGRRCFVFSRNLPPVSTEEAAPTRTLVWSSPCIRSDGRWLWVAGWSSRPGRPRGIFATRPRDSSWGAWASPQSSCGCRPDVLDQALSDWMRLPRRVRRRRWPGPSAPADWVGLRSCRTPVESGSAVRAGFMTALRFPAPMARRHWRTGLGGGSDHERPAPPVPPPSPTTFAGPGRCPPCRNASGGRPGQPRRCRMRSGCGSRDGAGVVRLCSCADAIDNPCRSAHLVRRLFDRHAVSNFAASSPPWRCRCRCTRAHLIPVGGLLGVRRPSYRLVFFSGVWVRRVSDAVEPAKVLLGSVEAHVASFDAGSADPALRHRQPGCVLLVLVRCSATAYASVRPTRQSDHSQG